LRHAMLSFKSAFTELLRSDLGNLAKPVLFAALLWAAAAAGELPIPGTPVPITLQTFVVMLAALMLTWRQAGAAVMLYLAAGAAGLPVFAGGASTAALVGPSAGFLFGFLPAAIVTSLLKGKADAGSLKGGVLTALRYFAAAIIGCVAIDYFFGFAFQAMITGVPFATVALASMGFVCGDVVKAFVASAVVAGLAKLR